jgi:malate dehydrogenase (oxaloacetate-decarboxylating)(NADP+)
VRRVSSHYLVLLPRGALFLADCAVNVEPDAEDLAEIALLTAATAELAKERAPGLVIDGEMQLMTALDGPLRRDYFPFSTLAEDANVLVFPDLQSGNLAFHLLQCVGGAVPIGPLLMGTPQAAGVER